MATLTGAYGTSGPTRYRASRTKHASDLAAGQRTVYPFPPSRVDPPRVGEKLAGGDLRQYFYPFYDAAYARLAAGVLPLWNPYQLCGVPWLGTLQGALLYPPHALYLVLPTRIALAASGLLHLSFAALSTAAFVRSAGVGVAPAVLAALLFAMRGTLPRWIVWPYLLEAAAWLPLGALAVVGIARGVRARRSIAVLAVATGASCLAGGPQATAYLLYVWGAPLSSSPGVRRESRRRSSLL